MGKYNKTTSTSKCILSEMFSDRMFRQPLPRAELMSYQLISNYLSYILIKGYASVYYYK